MNLALLRCANRNQRATWDTLVQCKNSICELGWSPSTNLGVKVSAIKFIQRVILVQTRGVSDPRVVPNDLSPVVHLIKYTSDFHEFRSSKTKTIPTSLSARQIIHTFWWPPWKQRGSNYWKAWFAFSIPASEFLLFHLLGSLCSCCRTSAIQTFSPPC
jgi:hypothetical protein